ncbi:bifunctional 2-polyprenyl-6-hydroxyphenol methylase/3-demethylubiquinol 3-O-methyltransferase UbiG [Aquisediminimonas sediminicola]|uniref:bifunctional 2-polyprenyl-6-hydroxyphenol methylase/3-demethylubiquinol 3-O-methyltransferase UbiG n=1 Tax=Alteraquisediminimonas sediminicola TaxID=2676787 RepID=UPI001C8D9210|nr:bifunctional 2-polyprenyl-6-hydroxyphenol methylase/3-demethylubiquinol 3-O-methyltransferase UbiG [Aquisediminimonas sediminicola]
MTTTIAPDEAAHFGAMAADWWNPHGSSKPLHQLNPVRLAYIRQQIDRHFGTSLANRTPLSGKTVLDAGCGAGLLCEPLARLGGNVTGLDAAPENIAVAKAHAAPQSLAIDYRCGEVAALDGQFDLVTSMEVIEHVTDPDAFITALAARLAPHGLMILSTPNRTALSRLMMIDIGEGLGQIPKGTHHWDQFIAPDELGQLLATHQMQVIDRHGIAWSPAKGFHLSDRLDLNYLVTAIRA